MKYLPVFLFTIFSFSTRSQEIEKKLIGSFDSFNTNYPQEKVFIHFDRANYVAGETIWFKAYVTNDDKPSFLSTVLYMELVNQHSKLIDKKMLKIRNGVAHGEFLLKDSLPSGTYAVNSYTLWMLNFPSFIFSQSFFIYNTDFKNKPPFNKKNITLQFFPEGGKLLAGITSKIAFKATSGNGLPVVVSGSVFDSKNQEAAKFSSVHDGMGIFELTPALNEKYVAAIFFEDGTKKTFAFPAVKNEGVVLEATTNNPTKLFIRVERGELNKNNYNDLIIAAQLKNEIIYLNKLNIDEGLDAVAIPKKDLPPGIMHIVILDKTGRLLAERLVFPNTLPPQNNLLQTNNLNTSPRKLNEFTVNLAAYKTPETSVSVVPLNADNSFNTENILTSVLLTSDLTGYVHDPGFYFRDTASATLKALDILLMTEIWKRYDWNQVIKNEFPKLNYLVESGISISGTLTKADGKKNIPGKINLWINGEDSTTIASETTVNEKNQFYISDLDFKKSATVFYQGTNLNKENALVSVQINPAFFDTLKTPHKVPMIDLDPTFANEKLSAFTEEILKQKRKELEAEGKMLSEVILKSKKRSPTDSLNHLYASDIFFNSDQTLAMDTNMVYYDIFQYLSRKVPGIRIVDTDLGKQVTFTRYDGLGAFSDNGGSAVQFFLNEVPVSTDIISALNPNDVGMVKIYKGVTGIALGADRGAIAIYTTKERSVKNWRMKGFNSFNRPGYSTTRDFFSPDYSKLEPESSFNDRRPTLFWQPGLKVNNGQKTLISFYNNDFTKKFRITIEGIDKDGNLIHIEKNAE